jgi:hypothetical protein
MKDIDVDENVGKDRTDCYLAKAQPYIKQHSKEPFLLYNDAQPLRVLQAQYARFDNSSKHESVSETSKNN